MKNISYLLLATILFFSNCSKDNGVDEILSEEITEADLVGDWDFVSLEFKGETYIDCDNDLKGKYKLLNLSFLGVTLSEHGVATLTYNIDCGKISSERRFNIEDNYIYLYNETKYKFLILNSQSFNGELLKIKLITNSKSIPADGIYTLQRN